MSKVIWVEQPAFKTNEFKVGDKVVKYSSTGSTTYNIWDIDGDILKLKAGELVNGHIEAHFKQCRLLVKTEPREFRLKYLPADNLISYPHFVVMNDYGSEFKDYERFVVREVFDEE